MKIASSSEGLNHLHSEPPSLTIFGNILLTKAFVRKISPLYNHSVLGTYRPSSMLRLLSSKAQWHKDFWKQSKHCHVGIHWKALAEYSRMSPHAPVFRSCFASICIDQISHQQHKDLSAKGLPLHNEIDSWNLVTFKNCLCLLCSFSGARLRIKSKIQRGKIYHRTSAHDQRQWLGLASACAQEEEEGERRIYSPPAL